jgi:uncharacterized protein involved in cysteine biosynthesis
MPSDVMSTRPAVIPCPVCGYHAPLDVCPHCAGAPRVRSLQGPPPRGWNAWLAGAKALFLGALVLLRTKGVKRWLIPPVFLTCLVFAVLMGLSLGGIHALVDRMRSDGSDALPPDAGFVERWTRSLSETGWVMGLVEGSAFLLVAVVFAFVAVWTFSVVYEAIGGPFFDTIQGRIEKRWFGNDPRETLQPPPEITTGRATWITAACALVAVGLIVAFFAWSSPFAWFLLLALPIPFLVAGRRDKPYGAWLARNVGTEARSLLVSVQAAIVSLVIMLMLVWVLFIPFIGYPTFSAIAGFAASITLIDIPCSRRRWSLRQRLRFVFGNFGPVLLLGVATSFVFVVPILGPIVGIPSASIGGQWLLCRLDKSRLRPRNAPAIPVAAG